MYNKHILLPISKMKGYPTQGFSGSEIVQNTICILNKFK
jgi:hypothetical protein